MAFPLSRRAFVVGLSAALTAASLGLDARSADVADAADESPEPRGYQYIVGVL